MTLHVSKPSWCERRWMCTSTRCPDLSASVCRQVWLPNCVLSPLFISGLVSHSCPPAVRCLDGHPGFHTPGSRNGRWEQDALVAIKAQAPSDRSRLSNGQSKELCPSKRTQIEPNLTWSWWDQVRNDRYLLRRIALRFAATLLGSRWEITSTSSQRDW